MKDSEIEELKEKSHMKTLAAVINSLTAVGYTAQFKAIKEGLKSMTTEKVYRPEEVKITNFYRFEGESDPSDNSIMYAIETQSGEKGTLIDAYGAYHDTQITTFIKEVEEMEKRSHKKEEE
ncbi:MAG: hypothetical protein JWP12_3539 [Bacteroidetes bacterium]|nr:hypothetical protein [Bacteroidota bacterium]